MNSALTVRQILVVEDNPGDVALLREAFGQQSNVLWHIVTNVIQARDFLARRPPYGKAPRPDLFIIDLHLPIYPGVLLVPEIRSDPLVSTAKIVILTSSGAEEDRIRCLELGADEFYTKPLIFSEWESLVRTILA